MFYISVFNVGDSLASCLTSSPFLTTLNDLVAYKKTCIISLLLFIMAITMIMMVINLIRYGYCYDDLY